MTAPIETSASSTGSGRGKVVISYAHTDRPAAQRLADIFVARGWEVWWDPELDPGDDYAKVIRTQIDQAGCVVVLWSVRSLDSLWVQSEARRAAKRGVLVQGLLEPIDLPIGLDPLQAVDLSDWNESAGQANLAKLVKGVAKKLQDSPPTQEPVPQTARKQWHRWAVYGVLSTVPAFLAALYYLPAATGPIDLKVSSSEVTFRTAKEQPFFRAPLVLDTLRLTGIKEFRIEWPNTGQEEVIPTGRLELSASPTAHGSSSITLRLSTVKPGATITTGSAGRGEHFLRMTEPLDVFEIALNGPIEVWHEGSATRVETFEGTNLIVRVDSAEFTLFFKTPAGFENVVTPLSVDSLVMQRRNRNPESAPTISTIVAGTVGFSRFGTTRDSIREGEFLNLSGARGQLRVTQVDSGAEIGFAGEVDDFRMAGWTPPSQLRSLFTRHLPEMAFLGLAYAGFVLVTRKVWRRHLP